MSVRKGQARLKRIAERLSQHAPLREEDHTFVVKAFVEIANGADADVALGVKAKRGERKSHHSRQTAFNKKLFFGWVATAIAPESAGGLGLSLQDAIATAHNGWPALPSEETLRRQWNDIRQDQQIEFVIKTD